MKKHGKQEVLLSQYTALIFCHFPQTERAINQPFKWWWAEYSGRGLGSHGDGSPCGVSMETQKEKLAGDNQGHRQFKLRSRESVKAKRNPARPHSRAATLRA